MQILIIAKSKKYGAFCLAGIDVQNNRFVRILGSEENGAFSNEYCILEDGREIQKLDLVELDICPTENNNAQTENYILDSKYAKLLKKCFIDDIPIVPYQRCFFDICDREYFNRNEYSRLNHSLEMVIVSNFYVNDGQRKCSFDYKNKKYRNISFTDLDYLNVGTLEFEKALIIVSLSGEDGFTSTTNRFYLFVSAVYRI